MQCDLAGKTAFVTGGANGIGKAIAERMAANGAALAIADVDIARAQAVAESLPNAAAYRVDIREEGAIEDAVTDAEARFGGIDILINNAGVNTLAHRVNVDAFPVEEWHRIIGVDLDGLFLVSRRIVGGMLGSGRGGRVVTIASVVGLAAMRLQSPFVAAKAGIIHLTRSMALELAPKGVTVNAVAPGSIMTDGTRQLFYGDNGRFHNRTQAFMDHLPLGRPGTVHEIAEAVLFLASPASRYVNGQVLTVDGGWTAGFMM